MTTEETPNCDTHTGLGEILRNNARTALAAWHDNPTPATMTAFTNACEPLDEETISTIREEITAELVGLANPATAKTVMNGLWARTQEQAKPLYYQPPALNAVVDVAIMPRGHGKNTRLHNMETVLRNRTEPYADTDTIHE